MWPMWLFRQKQSSHEDTQENSWYRKRNWFWFWFGWRFRFIVFFRFRFLFRYILGTYGNIQVQTLWIYTFLQNSNYYRLSRSKMKLTCPGPLHIFIIVHSNTSLHNSYENIYIYIYININTYIYIYFFYISWLWKCKI